MAPRRSGTGCSKQHRDAKVPASAQKQEEHPPDSIYHQSIEAPVDTPKGDTTAQLKHSTMELAEKVVIIEERTTFLGDLINIEGDQGG